ncbi:MAG: hypothetical protein ABSD72_17265 [Terracidiphilus sp.]|jgi:hypothetical protein
MTEIDLRYLFVVPVALAEAFLLWALWQLQTEIRKERKRQGQIPSSLGSTAQRLFPKTF